MFDHRIAAGESIDAIAHQYGIDWRDLADINGLDPLNDILLDGILDIPTTDELLAPARPLLSSLKDAEAILQRANDLLPESLSNYTAEALAFVGEVNGAIESAESTISDILGEADRVLSGGSAYGAIDWLLTKVSPDRSRFAGALAKVQEVSSLVQEIGSGGVF